MPKKKTTLSKLVSREHSLFYVIVWDTAIRKDWGQILSGIKNLVFINTGNGKTAVYSDLSEIAEISFKISKRIKNKENYFEKIKKCFIKKWNPFHEYISGEKEIRNVDDLKDYFEKWHQAWSLAAIISLISDTEEIPSKIRNKALEIRSKNEKYADSGDKVFVEAFERLFPKYKEITQIITPEEIWELGKGLSENEYKQIEERNRGYVLINGELSLYENLNNDLKKYDLELSNYEPKDKKEIKGSVAYEGNVKGKIRVIHSKNELGDIQKGEILVTEMTSPDYLSAMKKSSAIITDEGGVMCHAAIVAREMKKPCIIGTQNATEVFKDGDMVEIDTGKGIVKTTREKGSSIN